VTFAVSDECVGIERKNSGQCECGNDAFESIQIKAILNPTFEIVLKLLFKSSKLRPIDTDKSGVSSWRAEGSTALNRC
jgi:hypothetical protein